MSQEFLNSPIVTIEICDDYKVNVNAELHGSVLRVLLHNRKCVNLLTGYLYQAGSTTAEMYKYLDSVCAFIMMNESQKNAFLASSYYSFITIDYQEMSYWLKLILNKSYKNWSHKLQNIISELEASGKTAVEIITN